MEFRLAENISLSNPGDLRKLIYCKNDSLNDIREIYF
jgi:hypothetical protein